MYWSDKYQEMFDDVIPSEELGLGSLEEIEKTAEKCVKSGKDAYTVFQVDISEDINY